MIALPQGYVGGKPLLRQAALLHELVHVRRRDWAWLIFVQVVCVLYWCLPFALMAARRLRREWEIVCEDCVLAVDVPALDCAAQILEVARSLAAGTPDTRLCALSTARPPLAADPIRAILEPGRGRRPVTRSMLGLAGLFLTAVIPLSLRATAARESHPAPAALPQSALPSGAWLENRSMPDLDIHVATMLRARRAARPDLHFIRRESERSECTGPGMAEVAASGANAVPGTDLAPKRDLAGTADSAPRSILVGSGARSAGIAWGRL